MKNAYIAILTGLAVLGIVYASKEPEKKTKEIEKKTKEAWHEPIDPCEFPEIAEEDVQYKAIEIGKLPVFMEVGFNIEFNDKVKIELEQVDCASGSSWPCYKGSATIKVKANFPAILSASLNKSGGDVDILKDINLYWEDGVNTIQGGTGDWEELKLCLEAWDVELFKIAPDEVKVGEITIKVKPKDRKSGD